MKHAAVIPCNSQAVEETENNEKQKGKGKKKQAEAPAASGLLNSEIVDMTVPQLKEELVKRGIKISAKLKKADLQNLLKEAASETTKEDKTQGKRKRTEATEEEDHASDAKKLKEDPQATKVGEDPNLIKWLEETEGTKFGNFIYYLIRLWKRDPSAKIIVFAQSDELLKAIGDLLLENSIDYHGDKHVTKKVKGNKNAKGKESQLRVMLLNTKNCSDSTKILEASHVILFDVAMSMRRWEDRTNFKEVEEQVVARAVKHAQGKQVTIVRFLIKDTIEHDVYFQRYGGVQTGGEGGRGAQKGGGRGQEDEEEEEEEEDEE